MNYLKKKNLSNHKESKKSDSKRSKEVTCYKCKKSGHLRSECPRLKHKSKGGKERKKPSKLLRMTLPNRK